PRTPARSRRTVRTTVAMTTRAAMTTVTATRAVMTMTGRTGTTTVACRAPVRRSPVRWAQRAPWPVWARLRSSRAVAAASDTPGTSDSTGTIDAPAPVRAEHPARTGAVPRREVLGSTYARSWRGPGARRNAPHRG